MAKTAVSQWDETAANNTDINSIPIDGAVTTPSRVDDIVREMMAQIKTFSLFSSLTMTSSDAGATAGPILTLYRNSASPAASDIIGKVLFQGEDSAGNAEDYAEVYTQIVDPTSASEDASILLRNKVAGSFVTQLTATATGLQIPAIGATTPGTGTFTTLTTTGAFTSLGIDDNATGERFQLADTIGTWGTSSGDFSMVKANANGVMYVSGGSANTTGANIFFAGGSHATIANDWGIRSGASTIVGWDDSASTLSINGAISASSTIVAGGSITSPERFISSGNTAVLANNGSGGIDLRVNGQSTNTNALSIDNNGDTTIRGSLTTDSAIVSGGGVTSSQNFASSTASAILAATGAGAVALRPNGTGSTTGQLLVGSDGTVTVNGLFQTTAEGSIGTDLTVGDDLFVGVTALINPAAAEYGMSVDAAGLLTISRNADVPLRVKRNGDGTLVAWYNGTSNVAVVSQASDVVTYGAFVGAHWGQWSGETPEVLRGTVLETVDEMCAWDDTESPEILPKVKVSDVVGSRRVYGVYSHPDSDGSGDFHVASLGAYVVRIAGGIVVQNGDLLESNGAGCARVQESEVFTSRTIAKVTSASVVETYPDGSYLVPATLHCG